MAAPDSAVLDWLAMIDFDYTDLKSDFSRERYIRAVALIGFSDLVFRNEGDPGAYLDAAGIPQSALHEFDSLISFRRYTTLMEIAAHELSMPSFGLQWALAAPDHFPHVGPVAYLAYFVETLRDWIDMGLRYWRLHSNAATMRLIEPDDGDFAMFRYVDDQAPFPARQHLEHSLANICRLARVVSGMTHEKPALVRFQHTPPRDISVHAQAFECPVEFNAEHNEIVFDKKFLDYRTNGNLTLLKPLLGYYIRSRIRRLPIYDQSMRATVALAISSVMGTQRCNVAFIADSLGLSVKKLQRQLAIEGCSFSELLEETRLTAAKKILVHSDAPVASIAGLLDYSTTGPFSTAFKRWTGSAPLDFRKSNRIRAAEPGVSGIVEDARNPARQEQGGRSFKDRLS